MKALILLAVVILTDATHAWATDYAAMGLGISSCAEFANLYKQDPKWAEGMYFAWAQGYLSGWNMAQISAKRPYFDLASLDTRTQQAHLRSYCDQHPLGNYLDAVWDLTSRFKSLATPPISN